MNFSRQSINKAIPSGKLDTFIVGSKRNFVAKESDDLKENQENLGNQELDVKAEAKQLLVDWRKIEAEAELIKQRANNKNAIKTKNPTSLQKSKPIETKKGIEILSRTVETTKKTLNKVPSKPIKEINSKATKVPKNAQVQSMGYKECDYSELERALKEINNLENPQGIPSSDPIEENESNPDTFALSNSKYQLSEQQEKSPQRQAMIDSIDFQRWENHDILQGNNEDESTRMQRVLSALNENQLEAKNSLYKFKLEKFLTKLQNVFSRVFLEQKYEFMSLLISLTQKEIVNDAKVTLLRQIKTKSSCFCAWVEYFNEMKFEKEKNEFEMLREKEEKCTRKAIKFYHLNLLKKYFYQGFYKNYFKKQQEIQFQLSQNHMKAAVNNFITKLKTKNPEKETPRTYTDDQDEIRSFNQHNDLSEIPERLTESEFTAPSEIDFSTTSHNQSKKVDSTLDKKQELELRAKQRKDRLDLIKKKHEEQKLKKEQEKKEQELKEKEEIRRRKIEEKQAFERKRQEEIEAMEKKQREQEQYELNLKKAKNFHRLQTLKYFGFKKLQELVQKSQNRENLAGMFSRDMLKKRTLDAWKEALQIIEAENEEALAPQYYGADNHYKNKLKLKSFRGFSKLIINLHKKIHIGLLHRDMAVQKAVLKYWKNLILELMKENVKYEAAQEKIILQFKYNKMTKKIFKALKENTKVEKMEKVKKEHKDEMWKKVNSWLSDYKKK